MIDEPELDALSLFVGAEFAKMVDTPDFADYDFLSLTDDIPDTPITALDESIDDMRLVEFPVLELVESDDLRPASCIALRSALDWADCCAECCSEMLELSTEEMSVSISSRRSSSRFSRKKSKSWPNQRSYES